MSPEPSEKRFKYNLRKYRFINRVVIYGAVYIRMSSDLMILSVGG